MPRDVRAVLSVGCGGGATEAELIRSGAEVTGIEINPSAAAVARRKGVEVLEGDALAVNSALAGKVFDCILYADVLEHIIDPVSVLRAHVPLLRPGGEVIISVPNFRNLCVFWALFVRGHVRYGNAGVFDRTHVRLTTRRLVQEWLSEVGLEATSCSYRGNGRRGVMLTLPLFGKLRELTAMQIIITARKPA